MSAVHARRRITGGSIGTFVEWYDFLIYALSAPVLALHFFPAANPATGILSTFGIYAIAFFMRPLGGVFFGFLGDRGGRIGTLGLTVLAMGLATMLMGLLPTYSAIGLAAPALLLVCRLLQGFAVGGETSGGMSYVLESAPDNRRALWVNIVGACAFLPAAAAALFILGLRALLGEHAYLDWAWRLPFIAGAVLALIGLWLRRRLDDPEEYKAATRETPVDNPLRSVAEARLRSIGVVILLVAVMAVAGYMLSSYMYTFLVKVARLGTTAALVSNATAITVIAILLPLFGLIADRAGRKPLMLTGAAWLLVTAYPALVMAASGTVWGAFAGQLLLAVGIALVHGGGFVTMLELFPTSLRYTGHAIAYNLGFAIFGGTTAFIATFLVDSTGSALAPGFYLMIVAVLGLLVIRIIPETKGVRLRSGEKVPIIPGIPADTPATPAPLPTRSPSAPGSTS